MKLELTVTELAGIFSALKAYGTSGALRIRESLRGQWVAQQQLTGPVAKDAADDGPEIMVIKYSRIFPDGSRMGRDFWTKVWYDPAGESY